MSGKVWLGIGATAILAVAVGLGSSWAVSVLTDDAEATQIPVHEENVLVRAVGSESEALRLATEKAGFAVKGLGDLPEDSLALNHVNIDKGPAGVENAMTVALLIYRQRAGRTGDFELLTVTEVNVRTDLPANYDADPAKNTNRLVDVGLKDVEVWRSGEDARATYTVWTSDRTYYVVAQGKRQPTTDELRAMIEGLTR